jgi:hypothetical protein
MAFRPRTGNNLTRILFLSAILAGPNFLHMYAAAAPDEQQRLLGNASQLIRDGIHGISLTPEERIELAQSYAGCSGVWQHAARTGLTEPLPPPRALEAALGGRELSLLLALPVAEELPISAHDDTSVVNWLAGFEQAAFDAVRQASSEQNARFSEAVDYCLQLLAPQVAALASYRRDVGLAK